MKYYLITTSSTSVLVQQAMGRALYLSHSCIPYELERKLSDYMVAPPYGLELEKAAEDFKTAQKIYDLLLADICPILNELHDEIHNKRYWEIILGHWLWRFVKVIINRYKTIEQVCKINNYYETATYENSNYSLAVEDSLSAILAFRDQRWNHELYEKIIRSHFSQQFTFLSIANEGPDSFQRKVPSKNDVNCIYRVKKNLFHLYNHIACNYSKSDKYFFISSYLPKISELFLHLLLKQVPKLWRVNTEIQKLSPNQICRNNMYGKISRLNQDKLTGLIRSVLFECMPICYLEGYKNIRKLTQEGQWPKNPKIIFTANNFDVDEFFKIWSADKIENGASYITAQHGGVYGAYKYVNNPSVEENTSDFFLTWGWTEKKHIPCCIMNGKKIKGIKPNPKGRITLIQAVERERVETHDVTYEYRNYFEDQKLFVSSLNSNVKDDLLVRLGPDYRTRLQSEDLRWSDFDPKIAIDRGETSINKIYKNSRLIVQSYDSTGLLETLTLNIPTIAFWRNPLAHLRPGALPYYKMLLDAGILCDEKSAAELVNRVYDDVNLWWSSEKIQTARINFCNNFARQVDNRPLALKNALISLAQQ